MDRNQDTGSGINIPGSATLGDHKILFDADLMVQLLLKYGLIPFRRSCYKKLIS
jgi:hypothetical protein